jgi:DNA-binding CsgD family transcriptional regulator
MKAMWPDEVLAMRAQGLSEMTIVTRLGVPIETIRYHVDGLREKSQHKAIRRVMARTLRDTRGLRTP